jgi:hypothetical protein
MTSIETEAGTTTLRLTPQERQLLLGMLEQALGDTRVEVHHTRTPGYRDGLREQVSLIGQLIEKLRGAGA